jgi:hypothetical protein
MNVDELLDHVDFFLITEANVTHTGANRSYEFLDKHQDELEQLSSKIKCIRMDLREECEFNLSDPQVLHANEQMIRDGFRAYLPLEDDDIVISSDADEVLFGPRVRSILKKLNSSKSATKSYRLRLHQIIFRLDYLWTDCNFQGPVIARAAHFLSHEEPQWRYSGSRTYRKSGTHFSWVMTVEDMIEKISRYSHRVENQRFATPEVLKNAIRERRYLFEPERKCKILVKDSFNSKCYPKSLSKHLCHFPKELR